MPMVALSGLIVVTEHTLTVRNQCQPVFQPMHRTPDGLRHLPDDDLNKGIPGNDVAFVHQHEGLHVGVLDNIASVVNCSNTGALRPQA
jgi:hypothetical protein